jgi:hypothetical protein
MYVNAGRRASRKKKKKHSLVKSVKQLNIRVSCHCTHIFVIFCLRRKSSVRVITWYGLEDRGSRL